MDDLISRQAAIDAVIKRDANCGIDSAEVLKTLPSAQPDVVHCRDCVHADKHFHCSYMNTWNPDGYCHCGKRKGKR